MPQDQDEILSVSQPSCHKKPEKPAITPSCCGQPKASTPSCHSEGQRRDWMLIISAGLIGIFYLAFWLLPPEGTLYHMAHNIVTMVHEIWWGLLIGILMLAFINRIPRDLVMAALGRNAGPNGIIRATAAGVMLDLCSHGILMVGAKLYERGASIGQVIAFLLASPWNSFSLTLILIALVGLKWTLLFIGLSMLIGIITGLIFDALVKKGILPENPNRQPLDDDFSFQQRASETWKQAKFTPQSISQALIEGVKESRMVVRWLALGLVLAALIQTFVSTEILQDYFGPTLIGLMLTMVAATIIEVCSEGSTPIAADLLNRGGAPGNGFAFLMTGVATDYTEIMVIKERTRSWKIALFLPLISVPQVLLIAYLLNTLN